MILKNLTISIMKLILSLLVVVAVTVLSCDKNTYHVTDRISSEGSAQVKLGYFSAYTVLPNTILYINGKAVSNTLTAPVGFPGGGFNTGGSSNGDYLWVTPGNTTIQGFQPVPATGNIQKKLFEFTQQFDVDKFYTFYITDTAANTAGFSVPDTREAPDSGFAKIKFVNAMPNVPALDLYKGATNASATLFAPNVPYKGYTEDFVIPLPSDSFFIRPANAPASTAPITRRAFASSLTNRRIYTLVARGYNGATATNLLPNLSVVINQ
jgi:hypothetical protein